MEGNANMEQPTSIVPTAPILSQGSAITRSAGTCQSCGSSGPTPFTGQMQPVLVSGKLRMTYPTEAVEKHFAQIVGRQDLKGQSELEAIRTVLGKKEYRYLQRQVCWTLDILNSPAYVLRAKDPRDTELFVEALRPGNASSIDVIIGEIIGIASPRECNNLQLPLVDVETIYSFEKDQLLKSISRPDKVPADKFEAIAREVFDLVITPNKGTGLDRAINYVGFWYEKVYGLAAQKVFDGYTAPSVSARPSPVSGPHQLANVCLKFRHRQTDIAEVYCCTVNLDGVFPFLAEPLRLASEIFVP